MPASSLARSAGAVSAIVPRAEAAARSAARNAATAAATVLGTGLPDGLPDAVALGEVPLGEGEVPLGVGVAGEGGAAGPRAVTSAAACAA
jgi:hypothetical protein